MALRKRQLEVSDARAATLQGEIPIAESATVLVTSETADHPIDHIFDASRGPGGSRWIASVPGEQSVVVEFDAPQTIQTVLVEIEEPTVSRTQELLLRASSDGGKTYRDIVRQEFTFSPPSTTFEREHWTVSLPGVTHLSLSVKPDKGRRECHATITALALT